MKIRETSNPMGLKFHQVMAEKHMEGDYKALADAFGVKTPSVYDWIDHARIGKDRFARLVEWSGKSLHWWFDIGAESDDLATLHQVQQTRGVYDLKQRTSWPFSRSFDAYDKLSPEDKGRIDGYIAGLIDARENLGSHTMGKQNGFQQGP